jgi:DNA-binding MarR family transcriptional regulator
MLEAAPTIDLIKRMCGCTIADNDALLHCPKDERPVSQPCVPPRIKEPDHIDDFLAYRMHNLTRVAAHGVGLKFRREIGISRRDWRLLAFVGQYPGLSLTRLAELTSLDTVVTSRCVAQLVRRGLLVNKREGANKRLLALRLSEAGSETYLRARACGRAYNVEFAACLSDDEARQLDALLLKLEAQARTLADRERAISRDEDDEGDEG